MQTPLTTTCFGVDKKNRTMKKKKEKKENPSAECENKIIGKHIKDSLFKNLEQLIWLPEKKVAER